MIILKITKKMINKQRNDMTNYNYNKILINVDILKIKKKK